MVDYAPDHEIKTELRLRAIEAEAEHWRQSLGE
jgi:hypothetical protein